MIRAPSMSRPVWKIIRPLANGSGTACCGAVVAAGCRMHAATARSTTATTVLRAIIWLIKSRRKTGELLLVRIPKKMHSRPLQAGMHSSVQSPGLAAERPLAYNASEWRRCVRTLTPYAVEAIVVAVEPE